MGMSCRPRSLQPVVTVMIIACNSGLAIVVLYFRRSSAVFLRYGVLVLGLEDEGIGLTGRASTSVRPRALPR
jgi:hypothetical protein